MSWFNSLVRLICLTVVVYLLSNNLAIAQPNQPPPTVRLDVANVQQDTDNWCWLAVTEMIIAYRMIVSPSQCEMIELWDNQPPGNCCRDLRQCDRTGLDMREIQALLIRFAGINSRYSLPPTETVLYSLLLSDMPVIAQTRRSIFGTDAVVIRGIRYDGWRAILIINNPMQNAPQEIAYEDFLVGWINALIIER